MGTAKLVTVLITLCKPWDMETKKIQALFKGDHCDTRRSNSNVDTGTNGGSLALLVRAVPVFTKQTTRGCGRTSFMVTRDVIKGLMQRYHCSSFEEWATSLSQGKKWGRVVQKEKQSSYKKHKFKISKQCIQITEESALVNMQGINEHTQSCMLVLTQ